MSRFLLLAVLLAPAPFALAAQALPAAKPATKPAGAAASPIDAFTKGLTGLRGRFVQRVFDAKGSQREESSGTVALSAPRQFRWEYEQPFPQLIVADGDHVWIYDPDLEQVTVKVQSHEEQQSPLAVLIDPGQLERQFEVTDAGDEGGLAWVELTPRSEDDAGLQRARLGFNGNQLQRMQLQDALGQQTVIEFSGWRRNPDFAADIFTFQAPAGVDVVGETRASAEVSPLRD
jgi:outer membrane lipoprotein carrier protein